MIRAIIVSLLALASTANAQQCEYKSVMTEADIEACKHSGQAAQKPKSTLPAPQEKASGEKRLVVSDAEYQTRQKRAADRARVEASAREWVPRIGMNMEEVRKVIDVDEHQCVMTLRHYQWCFPCKVNKTQDLRGTHEQWVIGCDNPHRYLYFDNEMLTSIQE